MATEHGLYPNQVLENQITDILNTKLDARALITIDPSLSTNAGLKKVINKYTYAGQVEKLAKGAKNTDAAKGKVTFVSSEYEINRYQQTFEYNDMDVMKDPMVLEVALNGAATVMVNDIKSEYFTELAKISKSVTYDATFSYETIVDALAEIGCEAEEGTFIVMGTDLKAMIRKDPDFKSSRQGEILYSGQFGEISGVPVLFSKLVPVGVAYVTNKEAVKLFVKSEGRVEQDHDIQTKDNTVVYDRFGVMALVDETKSVKITKKA